MPNDTDKIKAQWIHRLRQLIGRTIIAVRYMTPEEQKLLGWHRSPVVLVLNDGTLLYPQADDEGNNAGALAIQPGSQVPGIETLAPII